jgi:hypothetical protein
LTRRASGGIERFDGEGASFPRELFGCLIAQAAVRAFSVVVLAPSFNLLFRLGQREEPTGVEAFVAQTPVETLHAAVLHRPARLNVQ